MSVKKQRIKVYDMTCTSCESRVERAVKNLKGILEVKASFSGQYADVSYEDEIVSPEEIKQAINNSGYSTNTPNDRKFIGIIIIAAAIALLGFNTGGFDMESKLAGASYMVLFITGVLTSIHCVGMCGGIMLSQSIKSEGVSRVEAIKPSVLYNVGRVVSYTALGGIIGAAGSVFSFTIAGKAAVQLAAGVFMVIMGLNMAGFSMFRKLQIKLPVSLCKVKNKSKSPLIVGLLNGFMPCGPLQTMQLFALGTGSAFKGAMAMFVFAVGTVPLMLAFGAVSGLLSKGYTKKLLKLSGVLVIVLGLIMGNRGLAIFGINLNPITALALSKSEANSTSENPNVGKAVLKDGVQEIVMTVDSKGFTPNAFYVKKGVPVKWIINGEQLNTCNNAIIVPSLKKELRIKKGENTIEFTPEGSDINFSCWMGMIGGVVKVVDNLDLVDTSVPDPSLPPASSGPSCCAEPIDDSSQQNTYKESIYGSDISKAPTEDIVNKASEDGSITFRGIGYEFKPLIGITANSKIMLKIDLTEFDSAEGEYLVINGVTGEVAAQFTGKKGINEVEFTPESNSVYAIAKGNAILGLVEIVDDVDKADMEAIRKNYVK